MSQEKIPVLAVIGTADLGCFHCLVKRAAHFVDCVLRVSNGFFCGRGRLVCSVRGIPGLFLGSVFFVFHCTFGLFGDVLCVVRRVDHILCVTGCSCQGGLYGFRITDEI